MARWGLMFSPRLFESFLQREKMVGGEESCQTERKDGFRRHGRTKWPRPKSPPPTTIPAVPEALENVI